MKSKLIAILILCVTFCLFACTHVYPKTENKIQSGDNKLWQEYTKNISQFDMPSSSEETIQRCFNSCVKIYTFFKSNGPIYKENSSSSSGNYTACLCGSGVIFHIDETTSYILTNYHVVYNENSIDKGKICFDACCYVFGAEDFPILTNEYLDKEKKYKKYDYSNLGIKLEFVCGLASLDLAILKCNTLELLAKNKTPRPIQFSESYNLGNSVFAIGNPQNEGLSATAGIVSVENDYINLSIGGKVREYRSIRTDTSIYSGSSGGGLFNTEGELIGITNAGDSENQNINYAIPLPIVKNFVYSFLKNGESYHQTKLVLGINIKTESPQYSFSEELSNWQNTETIIIDSVNQNSVAKNLGLEKGDVLKSIKIDSEEFYINKVYVLSDALFLPQENSKISVLLERNGEEKNFSYIVKASDLVKLD